MMDFGAHYNNYANDENHLKYKVNFAFEILRFLKHKRSTLMLSKCIKKVKHREIIEERLGKLKPLWQEPASNESEEVL